MVFHQVHSLLGSGIFGDRYGSRLISDYSGVTKVAIFAAFTCCFVWPMLVCPEPLACR